MPQLLESPLEIVELVVDNLANDKDGDERIMALKNCALVCRLLHPLCRKRIFASINISQFQTMENLAALLRASPEIANYTRSLTLHLGFIPLPQELKFFSRLESYKLAFHKSYSFDPSANYLDFNKMGPRMKETLLHPIPTLKYLELSRIANFPFSALLTSCPSLHWHLDASYTDVNKIHILKEGSPLQSTGLDKFYYKRATTTENIFQGQHDGRPVIDLSTLKYVHLGLQHSNTRIDNADRLETFILVAGVGFHSKGLAALLLPSIQILKEISICTEVAESGQDPLSGLCEELEILGNQTNVVEKLTVELRIFSECSTGNEWRKLDQVIERLAWPMLKTIKIRIILEMNQSDSENVAFRSSLDALPEKQLRSLSAKSKENLDFQFCVDNLV